jgi:hypothetical protein
VFQLLLTTTILESPVIQMKHFASHKKQNFDFCLEELQAFIGLNIAMGVLHLPQLRDFGP